MQRHFGGIHKAAAHEGRVAGRIAVHEEYGEKTEESASYRIEQVFKAGRNSIFCQLMQDERNRRQGQQLEAEIHGDQIGGHADRQKRAVGNEIERKEHGRALFLLHVFEGVETDCRIQHGCHDRKQASQTVPGKRESRPLCKRHGRQG